MPELVPVLLDPELLLDRELVLIEPEPVPLEPEPALLELDVPLI